MRGDRQSIVALFLLVGLAMGPAMTAQPAQVEPKGGDQKKNEPNKTPVQVSGKVVGRNLQPLAGAEVIITAAAGAIATKKTGADGAYSFEVPPGSYIILASKAGHKSDPRKFEVTKKIDLPDLLLNTEQ